MNPEKLKVDGFLGLTLLCKSLSVLKRFYPAQNEIKQINFINFVWTVETDNILYR